MSNDVEPYKPERDSRGRYKTSGNLRGRPKKIDMTGADADPYVFANSELEVNLNGANVTMTRQEFLLNRLYQMAVKGDPRLIIYLDQKFTEAEQIVASARLDLLDLVEKWKNAPLMSSEADFYIHKIHRIIGGLQTMQRTIHAKDADRRRKKKRRA